MILDWKKNPHYDKLVLNMTENGHTNAEIAEHFTQMIGSEVKANQISKRKYNNSEYYASNGVKVQGKGALQKHFQETADDVLGLKGVNTKPDGSVELDGTMVANSDQLADDDYLLEMFGYDKDVWTVVSSSSTIWDGAVKGGKQKMYRCKVTVKRKVVPLSLEKITSIVSTVKPIKVKDLTPAMSTKGATMLIPMYDKHFGISDLNHYSHEMNQIATEMAFYSPETTIISLGGDIFHNDSIVHGTTTKGTIIDKVDMIQAIGDFIVYFDTIMEQAVRHSDRIVVVAVAGNHDTTIGYLVAQMLEIKWSNYDKVEFDVSFGYRKAIVVDDVFLGFAHGDKARKNIAQLFANEFPELWGKAHYREVLVGHLHSNKGEKPMYEDVMGCMVRQMPSYNKLDDYHTFNGYTMATAQTLTLTYANGTINTINHYGGGKRYE